MQTIPNHLLICKKYFCFKVCSFSDKRTEQKKNWQSITIFCREALQNRRVMIILEESENPFVDDDDFVFMAQQLSSFLWLVSYLQSHSFLKGLFLLFSSTEWVKKKYVGIHNMSMSFYHRLFPILFGFSFLLLNFLHAEYYLR